MYYTVYLDVIFFENTIVNLIVIYISGKITGKQTSWLRKLLAAGICSIANISGFLFLFKLNHILQICFNFICISMMTYILNAPCFKQKLNKRKNNNIKNSKIRNKLLETLTTEFLLIGIMAGICTFCSDIITYLLGVAISGIIALLCIKFINYEKTIKNGIHQVHLILGPKKEAYFNGFVDSGNMLIDPFTGKKVIICDLKVMQAILPEEFSEFTAYYLATGILNYELLQSITSELMIYPVTCSTVTDTFSVLPCLKCSEIIIDNTEHLNDSPICFTKNKFGNGYNILLPSHI